MLHETPPLIARALARHVPVCGRLFLDPAVGTGALVEAVVPRLRGNRHRFVCVDINDKNLRGVSDRIDSGDQANRVSLLHGDFLSDAFRFELRARFGLFDCVVMNPPFLGRKKNWQPVEIGSNEGKPNSIRKAAPEAAFVLYAVEMLRPGGRLVAILPSSLIAGDSLSWIRRHLLTLGSFRRVHELLPKTFPNVDAATFLVVFEKSVSTKLCTLCNHRLVRPDKLRMELGSLNDNRRLDYGYYSAVSVYRSAVNESMALGWRRLGDLADIHRGEASSSTKSSEDVHSTSYESGFWRIPKGSRTPRAGNGGLNCTSGDLMVTRVGRNCSSTFGLVVGNGSRAFTDCVLRIRPRERVSGRRLLFALRSVYACGVGRLLLERGGGASYLAKTELSDVLIPTLLWKQWPDEYRRYDSALSRRRFCEMVRLEMSIRCSLSIRDD